MPLLERCYCPLQKLNRSAFILTGGASQRVPIFGVPFLQMASEWPKPIVDPCPEPDLSTILAHLTTSSPALYLSFLLHPAVLRRFSFAAPVFLSCRSAKLCHSPTDGALPCLFTSSRPWPVNLNKASLCSTPSAGRPIIVTQLQDGGDAGGLRQFHHVAPLDLRNFMLRF
jgi:hypothetical protein